MTQDFANAIKMSFDRVRSVLNEFRVNWSLAKDFWRKDELYQWINNWMDKFLQQTELEERLNVIQQLADDLEGCLAFERCHHQGWQSTCQEKGAFVTAYMSNEIIRVQLLVNDIWSHCCNESMQAVDADERTVRAANLPTYEQDPPRNLFSIAGE